jgi:hypothetical protein
MNITQTMQKHAKQYMQQALLGTWVKAGNGRYVRITGEEVIRRGSSWIGIDLSWQSAYAAMSHIDYINKAR